MAGRIQGKEANDYIAKVNSGKTPQQKQNFLQAIFSAPLKLGKQLGEDTAMQRGETAPQYLSQTDYNNFKNNKGLEFAKSGIGTAAFFLPGSVGFKGAKGLITAGALAGGATEFGNSQKQDVGGLIGDTIKGAGTGAATAGLLNLVGKGINKVANKGLKDPTIDDLRKVIASQGDDAVKLGNTGNLGDVNSISNALSNGSLDDALRKNGFKVTPETRKSLAAQLTQELGDNVPARAKSNAQAITNGGDDIAVAGQTVKSGETIDPDLLEQLNNQSMQSGKRNPFATNQPNYQQAYDDLTKMRQANTASPEDFIKQEELVQSLKPKNKLQQTFRNMRGSELDVPRGKYDFNAVDTKQALQDNLNARGLSFDLKGIQKAKEQAGQQLDAYIDDIYRADPKRVYNTDQLFGQNFNDNLDSLAISLGTDRNKLNNFVKSFTGNSKYGSAKDVVTKDYTIGDVKQMVQDINKALRDKSVTGPRKQVAQMIKTELMDTLTADAPEYGKIAKEYAIYASAENPTALKQLRGEQTASTNVINEATTKIANKAKRVIGSVGDKVTSGKLPGGQTAQKLAQNLQGMQKYLENSGLPRTQIAAIMGAHAMNDYLDNNKNGIPDNQEAGMTDGDGVDSENVADVASEANPLQQKREQLAESLLSMKDSKGRPMYDYKSALEQADAALQIGGNDTSSLSSKATKAPSTTEKKLSNQATTGLKALDRLSQKLSTDRALPLKTKIPGILQPKDVRQYNNDIKLAAEMFGRVQSGGAINKEEEKRFVELINDAFADPETSAQKIEQIKEYFSGL